jgi:exonuclease VII large subunit
MEELRRMGQAQAAIRVVRQMALAEHRAREAANGTAAVEAERIPSRGEVAGWVRDELEVSERRIQQLVEAAERRLVEMIDERVAQRVARAGAAVERRLDQRADELQARGESALNEAEARIREAEERLSRKARRHELKLAQVEQKRRIAAAERRLARRGEAISERLRLEAADAEYRLTSLQRELEEGEESGRPRVREVAAKVRSVERQLQDVELGLAADRRRLRALGSVRS